MQPGYPPPPGQPQQPASAGPAFTVGAGGSDIPEGWYPMILTDIGEPKAITSQYGETQLRDWNFQVVGAGQYEDTEVRGATTTATGPKSKAYAWLRVLLGREPQKGEQIAKESITGRVVYGYVERKDDWPRVGTVAPLPPTVAEQAFGQMTGAPMAQAPQPSAPPAPAYQPAPQQPVVQTMPVPSAPVPQQVAPAPAPQQPGQFVMPAGQPAPGAAAPPLREQVAGNPANPHDLPF